MALEDYDINSDLEFANDDGDEEYDDYWKYCIKSNYTNLFLLLL